MHWNEIQGCLVLCFSAYDSFSLLIFCTAHSLPFHSPGWYTYDTNHMSISDTELSTILVVFLRGRKDDDPPLRTAWDHWVDNTCIFRIIFTFPKILKCMLYALSTCIKLLWFTIENPCSKTNIWPLSTVFLIKAISTINEVYTYKPINYFCKLNDHRWWVVKILCADPAGMAAAHGWFLLVVNQKWRANWQLLYAHQWSLATAQNH